MLTFTAVLFFVGGYMARRYQDRIVRRIKDVIGGQG